MSLPLLVLSAVLIIGFLTVVFWLWILWRYRSLTSAFPSLDVPVVPILGQLYIMSGNDFFKLLLNKIKKAPVIFWMGPVPTLIIHKPEDMACILKSLHALDRPHIVDRLIGVALNGGLLLTKGAKWQLHRKIMSPAFSSRNMVEFIPKINEEMTKLIDVFDHVHGYFDVKAHFLEMTFKISTFIFMGLDFSSKDCQFDLSTYVTAANTVKLSGEERLNKFWLHSDFTLKMSSLYKTFKENHDRLEYMKDELFDGKIDERKRLKSSKADFLGFLLDATEKNPQFTVQEARDQLITLIMAGYDSTATAAAFACLALAHHPDIQTKLYHELEHILPDPNQEITAKIIDNLIYLDMVIKETLRYFTIAPLSARVVTEPIVLPDGRIIPAGTTALIFFHMTHRDEKHWRNADVFDPERFTAENSAGRHPFAFLAFSGSKRNCIGGKLGMLMLKVMLAKMIRNFCVTTDLTWDEVTNFQYGVTMSLPTDYRVKLTSRNLLSE